VRRGDFVTVAFQGDFGKPRPAIVIQAIVIQADAFGEHSTVTVLPVTSTRLDAPLLRVPVHPTPENGLRTPSQVMIDKAVTVNRNKVEAPFGRIDGDTMIEIERRVAVFLGIVK
jgi:mRNA interferase MazF